MKTAIDLFCGGGGASVGLERAGVHPIGLVRDLMVVAMGAGKEMDAGNPSVDEDRVIAPSMTAEVNRRSVARSKDGLLELIKLLPRSVCYSRNPSMSI